MIDKSQIEAIKGRFDLLAYAGQHCELRKVAAKEWAGPCPMCGGNDRFRVRADGWFCRHCKNEPWQDAITLVMALENCTFADALARMDGHAFTLPPERRRAVASAKSEQPADWAGKAAALLQTAQAALYSDKDTRGADYLTKRGLTPATWQRFGLGYCAEVDLQKSVDYKTGRRTYPPQPAILIPWYADRRLVAIQNRFVNEHIYIDIDGKEHKDKHGKGEKAKLYPGSRTGGYLFGGQALARVCEDLRTLVICEGEINAMSIYQIASATKVDVLSIGSESQHLTPAMADYALKFSHIIVWADRPQVAKNLMAALPGAYGVASPGGQDANDLLRTGDLGGYLTAWRFQICRTKEQRDALYYDLWDAAQFGAELDAGTLQVMRHIEPCEKEIDRVPIFRAVRHPPR